MKLGLARMASTSAALGIALSVLAMAPASAVPAYCTASVSGNNSVAAYCYTSASGTIFRAVARCRYVTPSGSYDDNAWYGPWRTQGDPLYSTVSCGTGWSLYQADAQTG